MLPLVIDQQIFFSSHLKVKSFFHTMCLIACDDDDDVYLGYYSGKMVSYKLPCLHVLRKTHKHTADMA
jgi:hypothetical protein